MDSETINELLNAGFELSHRQKQQRLLPLLSAHAKHAEQQNQMLAKLHRQLKFEPDAISEYEDLPYLPVSMFKQFDLATVESDKIVRTLLSSATTTGQPSRIPLDKTTSIAQTKGLANILKDVLGKQRRPFLVLDCAEINQPGAELSARGAAVRGIMPFASDICYGLRQTESGLEPNLEALNDFFTTYADQPVLLFGFTFMVWTDLIEPLRQQGIHFEHPQMTLLHSGGWKKLKDQQVDKTVFNAGVAEVFGCAPEQVRDFYGMVEQVGVVFVDCEAGHKHSPAFAEVLIRDFDSLKPVKPGQQGLIQVMSALPNSYPGYALITEDVGELLGYDDCSCGRKGLYFRFRSRVEQAEVRGCGDTQATSRLTASATNPAAPKPSTDVDPTNQPSTFQALRQQLLTSQACQLSLELKLQLLDNAADQLLDDPPAVEGLAFLCSWMRRSNLQRVLKTNFGERWSALEQPYSDGHGALLAAPRGLVGHWVAGNVPTLAVFSWVLATLAGNASIVRPSTDSLALIHAIFERIRRAKVSWQGRSWDGEALLSGTHIAELSSQDLAAQQALSTQCDARMLWGGSEAIQSIRNLPCPEHCEDLVFGPKFSVAVADRKLLTDPEHGPELAKQLARDLAMFDQQACSSPQILYIDTTSDEDQAWLELLHQQLARQQQLRPRRPAAEATAAAVLNQRASYGLDPDKQAWCSDGTEHSLLVAEGATLHQAVQGRTLYVQRVKLLEQVLKLLNPKVQTLGVAIGDPDQRHRFCQAAAMAGVSRCVELGTMNLFETPWDGMLPLTRLVRWVRLPGLEPQS